MAGKELTPQMKIAFIHYHLKPGGVTTVLQHQVNAVARFGEALIISGEAAESGGESGGQAEVITIDGLAYDTVRSSTQTPAEVAELIMNAIYSAWPEGCDLIHIHNPTLAKNRNFLAIIAELQQRRIPLFLQIHDFAEDGRPDLYFPESYPENCHYGVINARDYTILQSAGLKPEGLHLLPNAVIVSRPEPIDASLTPCILYPVRAIRRKNIGEAVLLSLFLPDQLPVRITLPPNSPADLTSYRRWRHFSSASKLQVEFDAGLTASLSSLYHSATYIATTSLMEGFGFSFLEPWLYGKAVGGRYLSEICSPLEHLGLDFSHLYRTIEIPLEWVGENDFFSARTHLIKSILSAYGAPLNLAELRNSSRAIQDSGIIDFGSLSQAMQIRILQRVVEDKKSFEILLEKNSVLATIGDNPVAENRIERHAEIIRREFSMERYAQTLKQIYQSTVAIAVSHKINKQRLVHSFINLAAFSLLKWE